MKCILIILTGENVYLRHKLKMHNFVRFIKKKRNK